MTHTKLNKRPERFSGCFSAKQQKRTRHSLFVWIYGCPEQSVSCKLFVYHVWRSLMSE